ncbi:hypothetical protein LEP1GSC050_0206 [Leptospira broomii serovar Hurstbridge str. 5399]|uniref:Activator of Hsp90 ATPase homologue 1/2-like C-terminal domain-containing protein n=1 Tax=Leptospira broomii serovar Hurstbridge str. 5399 TaxID=1049789 RepID=T0F6A0_9LEPT|nr:SRPBCC domain-containing protein [Leptospira broomii]EQA46615.1 hypothetical protein LEP1GSC050_0206 [Leptospira broomii serovar Hurstbridge str. 5399]
MKDKYLTKSITVDQTSKVAFDAINNVRAWWFGEIKGSTDKLGDEFTYRHEDVHYSKQKITDFVPDEKVVWLVLESSLNFVGNKKEWDGTEIIFEIKKKGDKTEVLFTHLGLVPDCECYSDCSNAWDHYINTSLRDLIAKSQEIV